MLIAAAAAFVLLHLLVSGTRVRDALTGAIYWPLDKKAIPSWTAEAPSEVAANKVNELFLPSGPMR